MNEPLTTEQKAPWQCAAEALLDLLESDFGQSGRDVQLEAIRCELEAAYKQGRRDGSVLPDSIQEALNSGDGVYRP